MVVVPSVFQPPLGTHLEHLEQGWCPLGSPRLQHRVDLGMVRRPTGRQAGRQMDRQKTSEQGRDISTNSASPKNARSALVPARHTTTQFSIHRAFVHARYASTWDSGAADLREANKNIHVYTAGHGALGMAKATKHVATRTCPPIQTGTDMTSERRETQRSPSKGQSRCSLRRRCIRPSRRPAASRCAWQ